MVCGNLVYAALTP
ncbi:hypothetical protein M2G93_22125 [Vibrio vulnificus]|nr:hypothetical protein [Vibrio vulnificus]MCG8706828.1 hypothetical protein [Vibrio vulnificus]MCG9655890.1 hypothetical protein [Vibrio vulnificus]MCU8150802.1 hypothetical protein [Vibrio vulnificus]MCU8194950.1 hypothetical protein [Vibrio vulnificus]